MNATAAAILKSMKESVLTTRGEDVVIAADAERRTIAHRIARRTDSAARLFELVNTQLNVGCRRLTLGFRS